MAATLPDKRGRVLIMGLNFQRLSCVPLVFLASAIALLDCVALASAPGSEAGPSNQAEAPKPTGIEIVDHNHYPELHVDGAPFFVYSASFFYYRTPRDQWEAMLDRYSALGINTIDLYIPWNWHEPNEGDFDFDGHTNPRRDLRALLGLIAQKHLRLIARPGPEILNEWRHGGFPDWLLERPEYGMSKEDLLEGRYAPLDGLNARDAEAAAQGWLANVTHMAQTRAWFAAVGKELAPYSSRRPTNSPGGSSDAPARVTSGPLLFVQLGDDFAEGRTNRVGQDFWRYCDELRAMIRDSGVDVPVFINPTDMRVPPAGSRFPDPIGVMGQWYMPSSSGAGKDGRLLNAADAGEIELSTEELATQPHFPAAVIEYQAGWYAPGDDDRPVVSAAANTLLSSRLLIANGIHGLNYFPLQDTYTPAGCSVPWANRSYRWDAALDANGDPQPRLEAVQRNSQLLHLWGTQLAASHKRADFGIIDPLGSYPQDLLSKAGIENVTKNLMQLERLSAIAVLSADLLDPEYQPVEQLLNDPLVFLPVFTPDKPEFQLSERAQNSIVEYVRRGGTLVVFPEKPAGKTLDPLWEMEVTPTVSPENSAIHAEWKFGTGHVIESTKDFLSWIDLTESLAANHSRRESDWAVVAIRGFLAAAGIRPSVILSGNPRNAKEIIANEIISNEGSGLLGDRQSGQGFLSVTNLSDSEVAEGDLEGLSPSASPRKMEGAYGLTHFVIPPRESMLLPLEDSLCLQPVANLPCSDAVQIASGELVDAKRDGRVMELSFYDPSTSVITLHLAQHPSHVTLESTTTPEAHWTPDHNTLEVMIPRGAAPSFLRVLRVVLPYFPQVPEIEKASKSDSGDYETSIWNALELPLNTKESLKTYPPLIEITPNDPPSVLVSGVNNNLNSTRSVGVSVSGPLRGSGNLEIPSRQSSVVKIDLKPSGADAMGLPAAADGLLHGTVKLRSGHSQRSFPIAFLQMPTGKVRNYQYDFDRDGSMEWALESTDLRLIVSPAAGGQVIALVHKPSGANLTTSVGLVRDAFSYTPNPPDGNPSRARGIYGLFNRTYSAEWTDSSENPGVKLMYDAPEIFPDGAKIEKLVQFDGTNALDVKYHVSLNAVPAGIASNGDPNSASTSTNQSFVAMNSFPAQQDPNGTTRFCWNSSNSAAVADQEGITKAPGLPGSDTLNEHCEEFAPGGSPLTVPEGIRSVAIRTPGRSGIQIDWECAEICAQMHIEPKNFSALVRLQFPPLEPGTDAQYEVHIRALEVQ